MADRERRPRLDQPREAGRRRWSSPTLFTEETFGVISEKFARYMGTPYFLLWMTVFVLTWLLWNTLAPEELALRPVRLHLPHPHAQPAGVLRGSADPARPEPAGRPRPLRPRAGPLAGTSATSPTPSSSPARWRHCGSRMRDIATRDFVRSELRDLLDEMEERGLVVARAPRGRGGQRRGRHTADLEWGHAPGQLRRTACCARDGHRPRDPQAGHRARHGRERRRRRGRPRRRHDPADRRRMPAQGQAHHRHDRGPRRGSTASPASR